MRTVLARDAAERRRRVEDDIREGYFKDKYGRWHADRRKTEDRRAMAKKDPFEHERRRMYRRKVDRELLEKDHRAMIEDALDDFAEEHGGQV